MQLLSLLAGPARPGFGTSWHLSLPLGLVPEEGPLASPLYPRQPTDKAELKETLLLCQTPSAGALRAAVATWLAQRAPLAAHLPRHQGLKSSVKVPSGCSVARCVPRMRSSRV